MLRRYHSCPAGAQDAGELGEGGRPVAGIVNGHGADDEVKGAIGIGQRLPQLRMVDPHPAGVCCLAMLTITELASKAVTSMGSSVIVTAYSRVPCQRRPNANLSCWEIAAIV